LHNSSVVFSKLLDQTKANQKQLRSISEAKFFEGCIRRLIASQRCDEGCPQMWP